MNPYRDNAPPEPLKIKRFCKCLLPEWLWTRLAHNELVKNVKITGRERAPGEEPRIDKHGRLYVRCQCNRVWMKDFDLGTKYIRVSEEYAQEIVV